MSEPFSDPNSSTPLLDILSKGAIALVEGTARVVGEKVVSAGQAVASQATSIAQKGVDTALSDKLTAPSGQTVKEWKAEELARGIEPQALPQQAVAAAHNVQFNKAEIVASQVVDVPTGTAVSPSAVGYGQVQQQGIALA